MPSTLIVKRFSKSGPKAALLFRQLVVGTIVVVVGALAGCGPANSKKKQTPTTPSKKAAIAKPAPQQTALKLTLVQKGINVQWIERGALRMSAKATEVRAAKFTERGELQGELIGFSGKLFEDGKLSAEMSAPRVIADGQKRILTAVGGVILKFVNRNTVIKSAWIKYYEKEQKIIGNGGVKVRSDTLNADAGAFVTDVDLKHFSLRSSPKGL